MAKSRLPLLCDSFNFKPISKPQLVESAGGRSAMRVEGVFQNYEVVNANRRRYPKGIWEAALKEGSSFATRLAERNVLGMIEHPDDGITKLSEVSHVITNVRFASPKEIAENADLEEGDILGTYETLPTPHGKILEALLLAEVQFGVSSRGNGTVTEQGDCHVVNEDYELETWDVVFSPSVTRALPKLVAEADDSKRLDAIRQLKEDGRAVQPEEDTQIMPSSAPDRIKTESSFVLATGVMNNGQQLIPVQLIAESDEMKRFRWIDGLTKESISGLAIYENIESACANFKNFCEANNRNYSVPLIGDRNIAESPVTAQPDSTPVTESTDTKTNIMSNALTEMRRAKSRVIQLRQTDVKGLKPSDKLGFFERITDERVAIQKILKEDDTLQEEANIIFQHLREFEDELDAGPPMEPAPEGAEGAGEEELPPEGGEGGTDPDEVANVLDHAAEVLDNLGGGDEEAADVADELRDISAELAPGGADDDLGEPGGDIEGGEDMAGEFPMESRTRRKLRENARRKPRVANRTERRLNLLQRRYNKLREAAAKLFERFKKAQSSPMGEGRDRLIERAEQFEEAAKELAGRYNADMMEMGCEVMRLKRPDIWETHGNKLRSSRTFDEFYAVSAKLIENAPVPASDSEGSDGADGSQAESAKPNVTESKKPADGGAAKDGENLSESAHPALSMVIRARNHQ